VALLVAESSTGKWWCFWQEAGGDANKEENIYLSGLFCG
jgi:hypothetical protein